MVQVDNLLRLHNKCASSSILQLQSVTESANQGATAVNGQPFTGFATSSCRLGRTPQGKLESAHLRRYRSRKGSKHSLRALPCSQALSDSLNVTELTTGYTRFYPFVRQPFVHAGLDIVALSILKEP